MTKKVIIDTKPKKAEDIIDKWVESGTTYNIEKKPEETKRKKITFDIDENLHKMIKIHCTENNIKIKDKLTEILEKEFDN